MGWRTGLALALLVLLAPQHCECISAGARNLRSSGTWNSDATVQSTSPLGIAAYAGIASFFPLQQYMSGVASKLQRPLSSLLLDFERVYKYDNVTMFTPGKIGTRSPNPRHIDAVVRFADTYLNATAMSRNGSAFLLLYLLNGPGGRNRRYLDPGSPIAYGMPPGELNEALCNNTALRTELAEYVRALKMVLEPRVARGLEVRLTGMLEDNLNRTGALALRDVVVNLGGWRWAFGRNVCPGCTAEFASDDSRVGDYWERHINSCGQMAGLLELHEPGDNWSNDGWMGDIPMSNVSLITSLGMSKQLWVHYWDESIQGYSFPPAPNGQPTLRFKVPPNDLIQAICIGAAARIPQRCAFNMTKGSASQPSPRAVL